MYHAVSGGELDPMCYLVTNNQLGIVVMRSFISRLIESSLTHGIGRDMKQHSVSHLKAIP